MRSMRSFGTALLSQLLLTAAVSPLAAQRPELDPAVTAETFLRPSESVAEAVLAPRHLNTTLNDPNPAGTLFLVERGDGPPTMALFAKPFYRLAGLQIDWQANRGRQYTTRSDVGIEIVNRETGDVVNVRIPDGARVSNATWSPDGSRIAYLAHFDDATHIFTADPANGRSRQATRTPLLATLNSGIAWLPDSRSVVTVLLPENRGAPPAAPIVPSGPQVRLTTPETNRIRTYPDLLEGPYEKALLEYYTTGQLAVVDVERRRERRVGEPAMISDVEVSPDGRHAMVRTMRKPFSYIVPQRQFGNALEVWNLADGTVLALLEEEEVRDGAPADTADNGAPERRAFAWRPDGTIGFLQAVPRTNGDSASADTDQGDGQRGRNGRGDRVFQWTPPFDSASATVVYRASGRLQSVQYSENGEILFLTEQQGDNAHDYAVFLSDPDTRHTIFRGERQGGGFGRFRGNGPFMLTKTAANGAPVVRVSSDGSAVFLSGQDREAEGHDGPISYIDRVDIRSGDKTRIYESESNGVYERVLEVLNDDATHLIVSREGPRDVPDSYFRNVASGELTQLTENRDFLPDITRAVRRRYDVTRVDGIEIAVNVTLPENWSGERLPGIIWFYPREYTDQADYDEFRERFNPNSFPGVGSRTMDILVREGYAVIEPDAPIIGDQGRMNDNYVEDLRNSLSATIDFLDAEGVIDRQRLGVGGHSYGAFSTMNAMVHTPFFKAGIAGDGNYNRTLTPFAFQSERRTIWESPGTYFEMSPIFQADHLNGALLMYHGEHDQNVGTFPINSWRLFESLEALGKTSSLYVYPYEDHGPATRETLLDLWARWTAWLDHFVKNAGTETAVAPDVSGSAR